MNSERYSSKRFISSVWTSHSSRTGSLFRSWACYVIQLIGVIQSNINIFLLLTLSVMLNGESCLCLPSVPIRCGPSLSGWTGAGLSSLGLSNTNQTCSAADLQHSRNICRDGDEAREGRIGRTENNEGETSCFHSGKHIVGWSFPRKMMGFIRVCSK